MRGPVPPPIPVKLGLGAASLRLLTWEEYWQRNSRPPRSRSSAWLRRLLTPPRLAVLSLATLVALLVATAWPQPPPREASTGAAPPMVETIHLPPPAPAAVAAPPAPSAPPVRPAPAKPPARKLVATRR